MKQTSGPAKKPAEVVIKYIRRATRRLFSSDERIRVVLEGLRGEDSIVELCRREGIAASIYDGWSKELLEAARSACRETRLARPPRTRCRISVAKRGR
jgi:transposase-like protein